MSTLTRKHFIALAGILCAERTIIKRTPATEIERRLMLNVVEDIESGICRYLRGENPAFDAQRFIRAAGRQTDDTSSK